MSQLKDKADLTRWNRSGLERFRYIDGNAVTYLETLRQAMKEAFSDASGDNRWQELDSLIPVPATENDIAQQERWLKQYHADRRDHAWEILRALARSGHILTEHMDTYANEHFLPTATEWENVRRLVNMLDYHPGPPASATTPIALMVKEGKSGTVETGFAFKNKPEDGSKPAVFETLQDIDVHADLNELRTLNWNQSQAVFNYNTLTRIAIFPLVEPTDNISAGTTGVLLINSGSNTTGLAVSVIQVSDNELELLSEAPPVLPNPIRLHQVSLLLKPELQRKAQLTGSDVAILEADHGLNVGAVAAWKIGSTWYAAFVREVEVNHVRLSRNAPAAGTVIYATAFSDRTTYDVGGIPTERIIMPTHKNGERFYPNADWDENLQDIGGHYHATDGGAYLYDYIDGTAYNRVYYVPEVDPISTVVESNPTGISLDGKAKKITTDDWLVVETSTGDLQATQIIALTEGPDSFTLDISPSVSSIATVFGHFATDLRPLDYDKNLEPIFLTQVALRSEKSSTLALNTMPELLARGRQLIIAGLNESMAVTVKSVDQLNQRIVVEPAIPGSEPSALGTTNNYTRYATKIYGNVVTSGHGESQSEKILGSGDATQSQQSFYFDKQEVSFVSDGSFPPGVRADVEVLVDGRTWQQVCTFNNSSAEDHHYVVRLTEDGTLKFLFGGDGRGRRLPSGNNNVHIKYRKGTGLSGNLPAYALEKEIKPHYLINSLLQPMVASGGNDMEAATSMRDNAPPSVLTLERAVSLADFIHLATTNSSVWQAAAIQKPPGLGRSEKITVAIVPAGGGALGTLGTSIESYLINHALPDVALEVVPYRALILDLTLNITVDDSAFDPEVIAEDVRAHILVQFSLFNRPLGSPFYRSQVFAAVEAVTGVENCQCVINPAGFKDELGAATTPQQVALGSSGIVKRITPHWDQVIYAHETLSNIAITTTALN